MLEAFKWQSSQCATKRANRNRFETFAPEDLVQERELDRQRNVRRARRGGDRGEAVRVELIRDRDRRPQRRKKVRHRSAIRLVRVNAGKLALTRRPAIGRDVGIGMVLIGSVVMTRSPVAIGPRNLLLQRAEPQRRGLEEYGEDREKHDHAGEHALQGIVGRVSRSNPVPGAPNRAIAFSCPLSHSDGRGMG
jgi:hypothetical protein